MASASGLNAWVLDVLSGKLEDTTRPGALVFVDDDDKAVSGIYDYHTKPYHTIQATAKSLVEAGVNEPLGSPTYDLVLDIFKEVNLNAVQFLYLHQDHHFLYLFCDP